VILLVLPVLTLLIASIFAVLPFGVGDTVRTCVSFLPLVVTHYWSARRPNLLPVTVIFACGLAIDVLSHGPIGFWAFMMLAVGALARLEETLTGQSTATGRAAVFAIAMVVVAALSWAVASLYIGQAIDGQPMLLAALVAIGTYPIAAILLMPIDRLWHTQRTQLFARGG
jgi:rod shape-determining protein MreD